MGNARHDDSMEVSINGFLNVHQIGNRKSASRLVPVILSRWRMLAQSAFVTNALMRHSNHLTIST